MAHFKLSDVDEKFLHTPQDATLIFAGASGTETFIERDLDAHKPQRPAEMHPGQEQPVN